MPFIIYSSYLTMSLISESLGNNKQLYSSLTIYQSSLKLHHFTQSPFIPYTSSLHSIILLSLTLHHFTQSSFILYTSSLHSITPSSLTLHNFTQTSLHFLHFTKSFLYPLHFIPSLNYSYISNTSSLHSIIPFIP